MCLGKADGRIDRLERDLELQDEEATRREFIASRLDGCGAEFLVGSRIDEDAILARGIDDDRRDTVRRSLCRLDEAHVDMMILEIPA